MGTQVLGLEKSGGAGAARAGCARRGQAAVPGHVPALPFHLRVRALPPALGPAPAPGDSAPNLVPLRLGQGFG